ncbi:uncharacterized protein LOC116292101 [Actinia tenebrosa]|uniref:Uncharacterized protein LOC116292101 n=1 Tax=Actinia tenebrosa TaxID=6105 RepID=A0A6P8HFM3_ACTTE|nr:uncharacterized protein LOC116292101 [Actinia tenebrosa]
MAFPQSSGCKILYHRLMLPDWLRKNAKWECACGGDELNLTIEPDNSDWDNIFRVKLLPQGQLTDDADITVKMVCGVILPEPQKPRDPMSFMISDGSFSVGIQLLDPNHDYAKSGPYKAVEGTSRRKRLTNPNTNVVTSQDLVTTSSKNNPDQFEITFKPSEFFGSAYCAIDDGHKLVAQYSDTLRLSKGLTFELYRFKSVERYTINYVEITIIQDSPNID